MRKALVTVATLLALGLTSLGVVASAAEEPPTADLAILSNTANVRHAKVGQEVIFTILARDNGPDVTTGLFVNIDAAPRSLGIGPVLCDRRGDCSYMICDRSLPLPFPSADTPSCEFSDVHVGELVTTQAAFVVQATGSKDASLTACVTSPELRNDPNPANDCATATVKIVGKRK
jgi:hypothetical protein